MKKTLLVTLDFPPMTGGVANYWSNLCRNLPADEIVVLAPECANSIDFDVSQDYLIYRKNLISKNRWFWPKWWPLFWETRRIIKTEQIQFLIVAHILPTGLVAVLLKKLFNATYGVSVHGLDISLTQKSDRKKRATKYILKNADWIMVNSNYTANLVQQYYPSLNKKIKIVFPCPNIEKTKIPEVIKNNLISKNNLKGKQILLTVGRLIERKGQDMVIKAVAQLKKDFPQLVYLIVGRGPDKERLEKIVDEYKLRESVIIFEKVADYELPAFYDLADIFIMPCRELADGDIEGFGIVFLEAGNYKKPVIAGRSGGAVEAVLENVTGLLVDPTNEKELIDSITELLRNPEKRRILGEAGYRRVQEQFNWGEQAKKIVELY